MKIFFFYPIRLRRASREDSDPTPPLASPAVYWSLLVEFVGGCCSRPPLGPPTVPQPWIPLSQPLDRPRATRTTASHPLLAFGTCQSSQTSTGQKKKIFLLSQIRLRERLLRPDPPASLPGGVLESAGGVCRGLLFQTPTRTPHSSTAPGSFQSNQTCPRSPKHSCSDFPHLHSPC